MNKVNVDLKELIPLMREQLDEGKTVSFVPRGKSMQPMLTGGEDLIILKKPNGRLHLNDVALYYRRETDSYVVHRVVGFKKDGTYVMLGDNNIEREYGISDDDIIGVLVAFYHKGKMRSVTDLSYKAYCEYRYFTRPVRYIWRRGKMSASKRIKRTD